MANEKKIIKEYTNDEITVVWQPHMCLEFDSLKG